MTKKYLNSHKMHFSKYNLLKTLMGYFPIQQISEKVTFMIQPEGKQSIQEKSLY